jgi:hypothetical protein
MVFLLIMLSYPLLRTFLLEEVLIAAEWSSTQLLC